MGKINILDPLTANQIAAGEVVERPVSVVKELLENSIDAGSTRIKITLVEGGKKRIQILDNGEGIPSDDLSVAVLRHATSKIKSVNDLYSLRTLGFRGEALPSIGAVSKMTVSSRTKNSTIGYSLQIIGGEQKRLEEIGCPVGTEITIDDLFYNTPARRKFLKSTSAELSSISDLVGRIAMSYPDIAFELIHEKRSILKTPGNGSLDQVVFSVYGSEVLKNMKKVSHEQNPLIKGLISTPQLTRSSRHYYSFFLNGRLIKSQELTDALEEAFHTRIPRKRYPIAILFFELSPELFDVNVHPAKLEVKFRDIFPIKEALMASINSALSNPLVSIPQIKEKPGSREPAPIQHEIFGKNDNPTCYDDTKIYYINDIGKYKSNDETKVTDYQNKKSTPDTNNIPGTIEHQGDASFISSLKALGQIEGTYIIASGPNSLYIIDQHAAHERIRYEKILESFRKQPSASSLLAVPITIELTSEQKVWLIDNIIKLADIGFILEHFGQNTFLLRGVPRWHLGGNSQELLLDLLEKLGSGSRNSIMETIDEERLFSLACKSAIKGNSYLAESDINFLLEQLSLAKNPFTCPHGRPIFISLSYEEIKRRFLRT
ncbi:MAG: DNA mismatch repair endonuclease MutL [Bacillota bacterium]|jgi:DNA mismatch repair protein MutL